MRRPCGEFGAVEKAYAEEKRGRQAFREKTPGRLYSFLRKNAGFVARDADFIVTVMTCGCVVVLVLNLLLVSTCLATRSVASASDATTASLVTPTAWDHPRNGHASSPLCCKAAAAAFKLTGFATLHWRRWRASMHAKHTSADDALLDGFG